MDARTLAYAVGVSTATLNTWAARGLIIGADNPGGGKRRHYSLDAAVNAAILAEFVRHGLSAPVAARICAQREQYNRLLLITSVAIFVCKEELTGEVINVSRTRSGSLGVGGPHSWLPREPSVKGFNSDEELSEVLAEMFPDGRPGMYSIIDVEALRERLRPIEEQDGLSINEVIAKHAARGG